jgi:hypothetical protein
MKAASVAGRAGLAGAGDGMHVGTARAGGFDHATV